jgi:hypothetical protein
MTQRRPLIAVATLCCLLAFTASVGASARLRDEPVIFTSGDWSVRKSKDPMTDKVRCTGLYLKRFDVQLTMDTLYISLRGRGGVRSYRLRLDEQPARSTEIASKMERDLSALGITGGHFRDLLTAQRLRISILTVLNNVVSEDISLLGFAEAHAVIIGPECKQPAP